MPWSRAKEQTGLLLRVRFHGRGGQGAKTASRILGDAAFLDGYSVQDFPLYGAERRGAPVVSFTRFSDQEISEMGYIFSPDVVAVMDESLLSDPLAAPLGGLRRGGAAIVNTAGQRDSICPGRKDISVSTVDLTGQALKVLGKPILSAGTAAAVARTLSITKESLLKAVADELREIGLSMEAVAKNVQLAESVYSSLESQQLSTEEIAADESMVSFEVVVEGDGSEDVMGMGNSVLRRTGDWRTFRPVIDYDRCTDCLVCYVYCPESALSVGADGRVHIDYENCKGCLICSRECPLKAIAEQMEVTRS